MVTTCTCQDRHVSHVAPRPSLRRLRSVRAGRSSKPRVVSMRRRAVTRQISGGSAVSHVPRVVLLLTRVSMFQCGAVTRQISGGSAVRHV